MTEAQRNVHQDVERQVDAFTGKYAPHTAEAVRACRPRLHKLFPRGFELVYDNYNALVFAFGPSERTGDAILSLAAYPRWVTLFFAQGASLMDPMRLLQGTGARIRGIRLSTPAQIDSKAVRALIAHASEPAKEAFANAPTLSTVVKSVSAKQRSRQPA